MFEASPGLAPQFLAAIASVPAPAWAGWFSEPTGDTQPGTNRRDSLVAAFPLPGSEGQAAICVFDDRSGPGAGTLSQAVLKWWPAEPPPEAYLLHQEVDEGGVRTWALASAWDDPRLRSWLLKALSAGASLRSDGWEWLASPERPGVRLDSDRASEHREGPRHDSILLPPGAVAVVYRRLTGGGQPELDLLRHLGRVPGVRLAPTVLGAAIIRSPSGERSASAVLEDHDPAAANVRSVIFDRLASAIAGDQARMTTALDDVRAVGTITRELHAALGRPFEHGVLDGAVAATPADIDVWVARSRNAMARATVAHLATSMGEPSALSSALELLPGKLQEFAVTAANSPGLLHRIHGNLQLNTMRMAAPRQLSIVEFDGDALLADRERMEPQSPWRDVARLLISLAEVAADAAQQAGSHPEAIEIARIWEREARQACLEGYGSGGGALHALLAIFELELASLQLISALGGGYGNLAVASYSLQRLSRTMP